VFEVWEALQTVMKIRGVEEVGLGGSVRLVENLEAMIMMTRVENWEVGGSLKKEAVRCGVRQPRTVEWSAPWAPTAAPGDE